MPPVQKAAPSPHLVQSPAAFDDLDAALDQITGPQAVYMADQMLDAMGIKPEDTGDRSECIHA